jgi:hypothetical protein
MDVNNLWVVHDDKILEKKKILKVINLDGFVVVHQKYERFLNSLISVNPNQSVTMINLNSGKKSFVWSTSNLKKVSKYVYWKICFPISSSPEITPFRSFVSLLSF